MKEVGKDMPNDHSTLISELTKIKEEGNRLYKENKIEEAKNKFKEGYEKFEKQSKLINIEKKYNDQTKELFILSKKILSNIALCYYKEENYEEAIKYDLKIIANFPKFGKSIVRLFNSYSKLNKIQQAVYYGDLFLELDQETRDKFKGIPEKIQEEKKKLEKIQKEEAGKIRKYLYKYIIPVIILSFSIIVLYVKSNNKK